MILVLARLPDDATNLSQAERHVAIAVPNDDDQRTIEEQRLDLEERLRVALLHLWPREEA